MATRRCARRSAPTPAATSRRTRSRRGRAAFRPPCARYGDLRLLRRPLLILTTTLALLASATGAASASGLDVIRDCTDDEVMSKTYTQKEYRDALRQFAADGDQYGNCRDVIRRAQAAAAAAKPKSSGANVAGAPTGGGAPPSGGAGAIGSAP